MWGFFCFFFGSWNKQHLGFPTIHPSSKAHNSEIQFILLLVAAATQIAFWGKQFPGFPYYLYVSSMFVRCLCATVHNIFSITNILKIYNKA